jgi:hypothetical protein
MPVPYTRPEKNGNTRVSRSRASSELAETRPVRTANLGELRVMRRGGLLAAVALAILVIAVLAAHGTGTSSDHPRPSASLAKPPEPGRLLSLRAPDPGGGLPWGLRLVRTHSGLLCAQVGRVAGGVLGQIGVDGAFHDDDRFHAVAGNEFADVTAPGTVGDDANCVATRETFSGIIHGLDRIAVANPGGSTLPLSGRREIAYGLLGPHALEITYRVGARTVNVPVMRGLGAYLVVRTATQVRFLGMTGAAPGSDYSDDLQPAGPTGFIAAITYRFGRTVCRDDGNNPVGRCHLPNYPLGNERTPSQSGL